MLSKEDNELYKAHYMQVPVSILTEENLSRLEEHCKKAIHFERGNIKEEHEVTLALLYKYKKLESEKQNLIEKLEKDIDKADSIINDEEYRYIQEVLDEQYERKKYAQEILEIVKGEKDDSKF